MVCYLPAAAMFECFIVGYHGDHQRQIETSAHEILRHSMSVRCTERKRGEGERKTEGGSLTTLRIAIAAN